MELAAVVVIFNPLSIGVEKIKSNMLTYTPFCKKVYIVDNSDQEYSHCFGDIKDACYVSNKNKGGIAGAHNLGCLKALEDGFDWVVTMDQDSCFEDKQFGHYVELVENYQSNDDCAVSFSPRIVNLTESKNWLHLLRKNIFGLLKRKIFKRFSCGLQEIEFPTEVIASGNIISLKAWNLAGRFDEQLFIEQVDYDFSHVLIEKGFKIVRFNQVLLDQVFGKRVFSLLKKNYPWYDDKRMYYVFRNIFIEMKRFPEYKRKYKRILRLRFFDYCVNTVHPISHFLNFMKSYRDFKKLVSMRGF